MRLSSILSTAVVASLALFIPSTLAKPVSSPLAGDVSPRSPPYPGSTFELDSRGNTLSLSCIQAKTACSLKGDLFAFIESSCTCGCSSSCQSNCNSKGSNWGLDSSSCSCNCDPTGSLKSQCSGKGSNWAWNSNSCSCSCSTSCQSSCSSKGSGWSVDSSSCGCVCDASGSLQKACTAKGSNYHWSSTTCSCTSGSQPAGGGTWKRSLSASGCPHGQTPCRVGAGPDNSGFGQWECLDLSSNIDSCGGCVAEGSGRDCSAIAGVDDVACIAGKCVVNTCARGWNKAANGTLCEMKMPKAAQRVITSGAKYLKNGL